MNNEIAKQILNCRSGKDGVAKILNGLTLSSGTLGGEVAGFAVATKWNAENPLYEALNHVKVSRMFYTTQDINSTYAHADVWTKNSATSYSQVIADTYGWSEGVDELPAGAESSGTKDDDYLIEDNVEKWYQDAEDDKYYQVIVATVKWDDATTTEPDTVTGEKTSANLTVENLGLWFYDLSGVQKLLQALTLTPNPINTAMFYKQLDVTQEDLDDLQDSGEYADFIEWVSWELRRHTEDLVISSFLGNSSIYTGTVTYPFLADEISSVFTTKSEKEQASASDYDYITVANVAQMVATVKTDHKWLVINPTDLDTLIGEMAESAPTADKYALAGRVGVDFIYSTELAMRGKVICLDPEEFWLREKNILEVAYPVYDYNKTTMLYEITCGIRPHKPLCSAMLIGSLMN